MELDPFKILVAVIVFGSALYLAWFSYGNRQRAECQARFNAKVVTVSELRARIADEERKAQVDFLLKLAHAGNNRVESAKAFQIYIAQIGEFQRRRAEHPLPHLTARTCD